MHLYISDDKHYVAVYMNQVGTSEAEKETADGHIKKGA